jgi:hypothetical protein
MEVCSGGIQALFTYVQLCPPSLCQWQAPNREWAREIQSVAEQVKAKSHEASEKNFIGRGSKDVVLVESTKHAPSRTEIWNACCLKGPTHAPVDLSGATAQGDLKTPVRPHAQVHLSDITSVVCLLRSDMASSWSFKNARSVKYHNFGLYICLKGINTI